MNNAPITASYYKCVVVMGFLLQIYIIIYLQSVFFIGYNCQKIDKHNFINFIFFKLSKIILVLTTFSIKSIIR